MSGKEGNRGRRPFRNRHGQERLNQGGQEQDRNNKSRDSYGKGGSRNQDKRPDHTRNASHSRYDKNGAYHERPRWIAPKLNTEPLPALECSRCGRPITDLHSALTDKQTGNPVHFDCVVAELSKHENLEEGDVLSYIGGGRFGIVHFNHSGRRGETGGFTVKKILEWEDKENRAEWRNLIADHYSIT